MVLDAAGFSPKVKSTGGQVDFFQLLWLKPCGIAGLQCKTLDAAKKRDRRPHKGLLLPPETDPRTPQNCRN